MKRRSSTLFRYWPLVVSLLMMACASTPHVVQPSFSQEYFTSRNGQLRYRLPVGWLNATDEAPSSSNVIWLVRSDFAVTLSVREVTIDAETRLDVDRAGLGRVAELTLALASGEKGVSITKQPTASTLHSTKVCMYEYVTGHSGDRIHIVLFDTGNKVYEVSGLITGALEEEKAAEVVSVQEAFVQNLQW